MAILFICLMLALNGTISFWNARQVGKVWVEARYSGGYRRFMVWMGAVMSAVGFSWCYLFLIGLLGEASGKLTSADVNAFFSLGYLLLVPFLLFSGYAITFDSWRRAYHQRTLGSMGMAGYNTFATAYNTYNAIQSVGPAFGSVTKYLSDMFVGEDSDDAKGTLVLLLVVPVVLGGAITTAAVIRHYAAQGEPLPRR